MPRTQIVFFDGGGGHRAAATALQQVLSSRPGWDVSLLCLPDLLDDVDVVRRVTGVRMQDVYNRMLARGWTLGAGTMLRVTQAVIRVTESRAHPLLEAHWRKTAPDLVVSVVPNVNRVLRASLEAARPSAPYVTILTDLADYPPHFWVEPRPQYFICGTPQAVAQVQAQGHSADRVFLTSGMILSPRFYEPRPTDRADLRGRFGLALDKPVGLILFGGQGSREILTIARQLNRADLDLQLVILCGRNEAVERELRGWTWRIPVHIEGFTREVPDFMHLSDFLIGKPGPGSVSEALAMGLPVIVDRNAWTLPQERFNAHWIAENRLGLIVRNFDHIVEAVRELLEPTALAGYRERVATVQNRAVFEIPDILERIISSGP